MSSPTKLLADRRLHVLLFAAALLRLAIGLDVWSADPTARALLSDSLYYQGWARALADGTPFAFEGPALAYWMPPLYAQLLAWVSASTTAMLVVQGIAGLVTTILVVAIGDLLFGDQPEGRGAALTGGLVWTLYGPVIFFEGRLLGATFATLFAAFTLFYVLRFTRSESGRELVLAGLALGLLSLIRPNTLLAFPALALFLVWFTRGRQLLRHGALLLVPALLVLTPALWHNAHATGTLVPVTANGGVNFFFGNNPAAHGTFHAPGFEWGSIEEQRTTARRLAAAGLGVAPGSLDDNGASKYWFGRGFDFLTGEPTSALRLVGLKAADLVSSTEFGIQYNLPAARTRAPSLWLVSLPFGFLLAFFALGVERKHGVLLATWLGAGALSALLYFTYSRFRLPLLPILVPFCGLGLVRLAQRQLSALRVVIAAALLVLSFIPFEGSYPRHLESHAFGDMAAALPIEPATRGERAELLDAALELVPGNKPALTARALVGLEDGDLGLAFELLERAAALAVDYPSAELSLAHLLVKVPDPRLQDPKRALAIAENWLATHDPSDPAAAGFHDLVATLRSAD
jgi:hypothetical protein